jgi:transcription antitermination factor NusG
MLQEDGAPGTINDAIVSHIRQRLAERSLMPIRPTFQRGQSVVIQSGPFRMVDAIFEKNLDAPARVQILVHFLGRPLAVEVDTAILKAAG